MMKRPGYLLLLLFYSCIAASQVFKLEEEFNGGTTAPAGWTFTSIGGTYTSNANYGKTSPSIQFNATGDRVVTSSWTGAADQVTFFMRAQGTPNASDAMLVEGWNGSTWTTVGSAYPMTTARIYVLSLIATVTQLRFTYTRGNANVAFDDVAVRASGNCSGNDIKIGSIMVDACDGGTSCEGRNEFITLRTGSSPVSISDLEINYPDVGTSGGDTYCSTVANSPCDNTITTNSTYVTSLNTLASPCNPFLDPPGGIIPANANVIVFSGNGPNFTYDFSTLCASGITYYAIFANNTSDCNGRFGNGGSCTNCLRDLFIRNRATGCTDTTYYVQSSLSSSNGSFTTVVNGTVTYNTSSCSNFVVLPLEIASLTLSTSGRHPVLAWTAFSEENVLYYEVEKSYDGFGFESTGEIFFAQHLNGMNEYSYEHMNEETADGLYFRVKATCTGAQTGASNSVYYSYKAAAPKILLQENNVLCILSSDKEEKNISVYSLAGEKLLEAVSSGYKTEIPLNGLQAQLLIVIVTDRYSRYAKRIFPGG